MLIVTLPVSSILLAVLTIAVSVIFCSALVLHVLSAETSPLIVLTVACVA
ncbi:hypothetical protein [[Eubacterium] hominis]